MGEPSAHRKQPEGEIRAGATGFAQAASSPAAGALGQAFDRLLLPFAVYDHEARRLCELRGFADAIAASAQDPALTAALRNIFSFEDRDLLRETIRDHRLEFSHRDKYFRVDFQLIADSGERYVLATLHDISKEASALKTAQRAEARLADSVRCSSSWVWVTDEEGCLLTVSPQITRLTGAAPGAFAGRRFHALGRFVDPPLSDLRESEAFTRRQPLDRWRFDLTGRDGMVVPHLVSGVPYFDEPNGRFLGYRGTGTDISARLAAHDALSESKTRLSHALSALQDKNARLREAFAASQSGSRAKDAFLASMTHEVRTPLTIIISLSEMIGRETLGPLGNRKYRGYAADINKSACHLLELIDTVLNLADSDTTDRFCEDVVDLCAETAYATRLVEADAAAKSLTLSQALPQQPVLVNGQRCALRQVLANLLSNAVKFTPPGGEVTVSVDAGTDMARALISDTGVGIPEEDLQRVFEPFERSALSYVREQDGSGLGLALCKRLTALQRGRLSLDSTEGQGTTVSISLPRAPDARPVS